MLCKIGPLVGALSLSLASKHLAPNTLRWQCVSQSSFAQTFACCLFARYLASLATRINEHQQQQQQQPIRSASLMSATIAYRLQRANPASRPLGLDRRASANNQSIPIASRQASKQGASFFSFSASASASASASSRVSFKLGQADSLRQAGKPQKEAGLFVIIKSLFVVYLWRQGFVRECARAHENRRQQAWPTALLPKT